MHSAVHDRNVGAAALVLCAAVALTACSPSDGNDKADSASPTAAQSSTPTASVDPKEAAMKEAVAAYGAYWQEMEKLYADSTGKSARLDQYAASAALANAEADAKRTHERGLINTGDVALTAQAVTKTDTSGKVANVTISTCLDISKWQTVDAKTKKPVSLPKDRLTKYLILGTVEKYPEGWRVTRDEPQGKSC
jgi:hypothetical protein